MATPFDEPLIEERDSMNLLANNGLINTLEHAIQKRPMESLFFFSPMGTGKTTLLTHFFNETRIRALAQEGCLIHFCSFSGAHMTSDAEVYVCLIDAVIASLRRIRDKTELYNELSGVFRSLKEEKDFSDYRTDKNRGSALLFNMLEELRLKDLTPMLILDNFQNLSCSKYCSEHLFSFLASLITDGSIAFIVATDIHAKIATEAYGYSDFERGFQIKHRWEDMQRGLQRQELIDTLRERIRQRTDAYQALDGIPEEKRIRISDGEMDRLWEETAGVPGLLQAGLQAIYAYKSNGSPELDPQTLSDVIDDGCEEIMRYWTKFFGKKFWIVLRAVYNNRSAQYCGMDDDMTTRLDVLRGTGMLHKNTNTQEYEFICQVFERYVQKKLEQMQEDLNAAEYGEPVASPIRYDAFISYKHMIGDVTMRNLKSTLEDKGLSVFCDEQLPDINDPGYHSALIEQLGKSRNLIVAINNRRQLTDSSELLRGDWVYLEMSTFKQLLDEDRRSVYGRLIILVSDQIFSWIRNTGSQDLNPIWRKNTEIMPLRNSEQKLFRLLGIE